MANNANTSGELVVDGEVSRSELGALVCDVLLLSIFLYNQIFYGLNMLFVILPLLAIGIYLTLSGVIPEKYHFTYTTLEVRHLQRKVVSIPYDTVFNLDMAARDNFINLLQENRVKVYHMVGTSKRLTVCRPKSVEAFTSELKRRCSEFETNGQCSKLEVFFND